MGKVWTRENLLTGVGLPGKIDDIPALKEELVDLFLTKNHKDISRYSVLLAEHILNLVNTRPGGAVQEAIDVNISWQEGRARFQDARNVAGKILALARGEKDPVQEKLLRLMAQAANTPHVARHALIASDYAVKLINLLYPGDLGQVEKERKTQIELMKIAAFRCFLAEVV